VIIGVIGAEDRIREKPLAAMPGVEAIVPVEKPYKLASYEFRGTASPVAVGGVKIGKDENVVLICGPCSVESQEQISSPHIQEVGRAHSSRRCVERGLRPTAFRVCGKMVSVSWRKRAVPPVCPSSQNHGCARSADGGSAPIVCKSARATCRTFALEGGRSQSPPVLLKRGFSATINDLIMSAEYILSEGNMNVLLCERGNTFENATRYAGS
jgi:3-deoxy-7-phosphoheptulonate synthase